MASQRQVVFADLDLFDHRVVVLLFVPCSALLFLEVLLCPLASLALI